MQKRGLLITFISVILGIILTSFVSAQFYGGFSLSDILYSVDPSTMILGLVFVVSFAFLNYALSRAFRDNKAIAGVIAFAISLGLIYWVNLYGLDFEGFFYSVGFSSGILYTITPLLLIGGAIFLVIKLGFGAMLAIVGGFLLLVSFTDLVYEKGFTFIIGIILLGVGGWLWMRRRRPGAFRRGLDYVDTRQQRRLGKEQVRYQREENERMARKERAELRQQEMDRRAEALRKTFGKK